MPNQKQPPEDKRLDWLPEPPGNHMPLISYFTEIFIRVRYGDEQRRLYVEYGGDTATFDFDGNMLAGEFPAKQRMYVKVWADIRRHDLNVLWQLMRREDACFKIRGLD